MDTTTANQQKKYATLGQLNFQRRGRRKEIEEEIRFLEMKFQDIDRLEYPADWFDTQDKLGDAYRRLMNCVRHGP